MFAFNSQQQHAIDSDSHRILVSAVPGSGKTATLIGRVVRLLEDGVPPHSIVLITFTRKAAQEMKKRLRERLPDRTLSELIVSTFHALTHRIIEECREDLLDRFGVPVYRKGISIIGEDEREEMIDQIVLELGVGKTSGIKGAVRLALAGKEVDELTAKGKDAVSVARRYLQLLQATNAIDVDALIPTVAAIWFTIPGVVERYRARWQHVLVDEFQDTDPGQQALLRILAPEYLFVVGDHRQAIYSFRGANPDGFVRYGKDHGVEVISLAENYRSVPDICEAANRLIAHNPLPLDDAAIVPAREHGVFGATCRVNQNADEEAAWIADSISALFAAGREPGDIAILARTNAALETVERTLRGAGIPTQNPANRTKEWAAPGVRWLINLLRVYAHPADDRALLAVFRRPGLLIDDSVLATWALERHKLKTELSSVILATSPNHWAAELLRAIAGMRQNEDQPEQTPLSPSFIAMALRSYFPAGIADSMQDAQCVIADWEDDEETPTVEGLLCWYSTRQIIDSLPSKPTIPAVTVATIHGAKGLEWPVVYIVGMEEGTCPATWAAKTPEQMEEERRVAFVGVTRARDFLVLSRCLERMSYGKVKEQEKSRFLTEMEATA